MAMAIAKNDLNSAREAFYQMPVSTQNETMTRYLAFKVALRSHDYDFANESLNMVAKHAQKDPTFLYACVLEAQQSDMRHIAVAALQAILDNYSPGVHLPALLRCTARLLIGELDSQEQCVDEVVEQMVRVFENAVANIPALEKDGDEKWRAEIQWWSKNAYNLSLRLCGQAHPEHLVRLLSVCTKFIDCYPNDTGPMHRNNLQNRKLLCHFLSTSALVVLGRSNDKESEHSLNFYLHARQEIDAFRSLEYKPDGAQQETEFKRRLFELLKFDLECILKLQQWDQLDSTLKHCLDCEFVDHWDTLADIVLIIHQQTGSLGLRNQTSASMTELLQRIINETWQKSKDIVKAARWLRLSFTMDLSDGSGEFAHKLLEQATGMAKKGYRDIGELFPETELQWLATSSFNKAVDSLPLGSDGGWERWIEGALELARYASDNGALHANLTSKREQVMERIEGNAM